ncbi:MAG: hypothetical protein KBA96_04590 [Rhodocyclaceae bacterium]|jgi:hypothetical protein|nr:hypothetical protein [Rhodocyclaceae bacterium]
MSKVMINRGLSPIVSPIVTIVIFSAATVFLTLGLSMDVFAGLFGLGGNTLSWKEEVLLHDGQIVIAERFYRLGGYPTIESQERAALDETVTFTLSATNKKVVWKTDFRDSEPEANSLNLILFDVVKGAPYIVTYPVGCIAYNKWKRPNPPQVLFKYEDEQWKRIQVSEFPIEASKANVIVGRPASKLLQAFYTAEQVNKRNSEIRTPEYREVLRAPISRPNPMCPDLVRVNGGWESPNGSKTPIPIKPVNTNDRK